MSVWLFSGMECNSADMSGFLTYKSVSFCLLLEDRIIFNEFPRTEKKRKCRISHNLPEATIVYEIYFPLGTIKWQSSSQSTFSDRTYHFPASVLSFSIRKIHLPFFYWLSFLPLISPHILSCSLSLTFALLHKQSKNRRWIHCCSHWVTLQESASAKCVYINANACTRRLCFSEID